MPRPISDDAVPDWVHLAISRWGRAKRRIWLGGRFLGSDARDGTGKLGSPLKSKHSAFHTDGFSARSVLAKIREERDGASDGKRGQHFAEVLTGDALDVQRALQGMPERPFLALHLMHVFEREMPVKVKAEWLECAVPAFYAATSRARVWIHARLEAGVESHSEFDIAAIIREILQHDLRNERDSGKSSANSPKYPQTDTSGRLNLSALRRTTLTLKNPA